MAIHQNLGKEDLYLGGNNQVLATCHTLAFQKDKHQSIFIDPSERNYVHNLGTEITEQAFNKEWNKIKKQIDKI